MPSGLAHAPSQLERIAHTPRVNRGWDVTCFILSPKVDSLLTRGILPSAL